MDRKEQEIMDRIKDRAEEIKAPDSLSPDHVKEMLEGKKQKKRLRPYQVTALAAACLAVVIAGAVWGSRDGASDKSKPPGSAIKSATAGRLPARIVMMRSTSILRDTRRRWGRRNSSHRTQRPRRWKARHKTARQEMRPHRRMPEPGHQMRAQPMEKAPDTPRPM